MLIAENKIIEEEIISVMKEIGNRLKIDREITTESIPSFIGFTSMALITVMGLLEEKLDITIPNSCYIFVDQDFKQLSIKGAAAKLIKIAKNNGK